MTFRGQGIDTALWATLQGMPVSVHRPMTPNPNPSASDSPPGERTAADYYVLGGGSLGAAVTERLRADGHHVALVDDGHDPSDLSGFQGDPSDVRTLDDAGVGGASTVVVAAFRDSRNLLIAQLVRAHFDVPRVLVLANEPNRVEPLAAAGHEPVCATSALSEALADHV